MLKFITFSVFFIFISACSSIKNAGVVYHDSFDFSKVQSYALYDRNSPFTDTQSLLDTRRNAIEIAIEKTMAQKKFSYEEFEKADLIVTYHIVSGKRNEISEYNEMVLFCTHCLRATTWITEKQYSSIRKGDLILDLIDPKKKRSVWRSVYPLSLDTKENSADTHDRVKRAISAMLAEYPK